MCQCKLESVCVCCENILSVCVCVCVCVTDEDEGCLCVSL